MYINQPAEYIIREYKKKINKLTENTNSLMVTKHFNDPTLHAIL